jgi:hypothetical protein
LRLSARRCAQADAQGRGDEKASATTLCWRRRSRQQRVLVLNDTFFSGVPRGVDALGHRTREIAGPVLPGAPFWLWVAGSAQGCAFDATWRSERSLRTEKFFIQSLLRLGVAGRPHRRGWGDVGRLQLLDRRRTPADAHVLPLESHAEGAIQPLRTHRRTCGRPAQLRIFRPCTPFALH